MQSENKPGYENKVDSWSIGVMLFWYVDQRTGT